MPPRVRAPLAMCSLLLGISGVLFAAPAQARTVIMYECLCQIQEPLTTSQTQELFTNKNWLNPDSSPSQAECQGYCTKYAASKEATFVSATYGTREERLTDVVTPILGVPIPGLTFTQAKLTSAQFSVNFIGEYITAVYNWLLGVAVVFAVLMVIIGGVQYMLAGGSKEGIASAIERIGNALVGVVILLGSYMLLYTTNPKLTLFPGLKISVVGGIPTETLVPGPISTSSRMLCDTVNSCKDFCDNPNRVPDKTSGMASPNEVQTLSAVDGLKGSSGNQLTPDAKQKLERAAAIALGKGYTLVVVDAYRPLKNQMTLVCNEIRSAAKAGRTPRIPKAVAWPGSSAHGSGTAIDVRLGDRSGTSLWNVEFDTQRTARLEHVRALAEIMYEAGWQRYHREIWHFQTNTGTCTSANQCFGYPGDEGCAC